MLGAMLNELAKIDTWLDETDSGSSKYSAAATDYMRLARVLEATSAAMRLARSIPNARDEQQAAEMGDLLTAAVAGAAVEAMTALLHFTKDTAAAGTSLLDAVRHAEREMIGAKARANRARLATSPAAVAAQKAFLAEMRNS